MKTLIRLVLPACAMTLIMSAQDASLPPSPVPGCHAKGVTMQTFYGTREDVTRAVRRSGGSLDDFRMHLVFVESSNGSEALLFERSQGQWAMKSWKGKSIGDVRQKLDAMVLRTRGSACAGEEMKQVLASNQIHLAGTSLVKADTAESIIIPALSSYSSGYLRVTLLDPCETGTVNIASR